MSEATAVIFGALIGAGGAIVAQVATAIATARRDRSRLDWEKQQQNREWNVREQERFLAIKQEQYARFGGKHSAPIGDRPDGLSGRAGHWTRCVSGVTSAGRPSVSS